MLEFSRKPIPVSLTALPAAQSKAACRMFRNVQGYMGERRLPFPAEVARELCGKVGRGPVRERVASPS